MDKYHLEGEMIYLREVRPEDVNASYVGWLNDPEVNRYLETRFTPQTTETVMQYVRKMENNLDEIFLAICVKELGLHIGNIKIGPINRIHKFADISLVIGDKRYWGRGIATAAIKLATDYAFDRLQLVSLKAGCYSDNIGSKKAFLKAGYVQAGLLSSRRISENRYIDEILLEKVSPSRSVDGR